MPPIASTVAAHAKIGTAEGCAVNGRAPLSPRMRGGAGQPVARLVGTPACGRRCKHHPVA